MVDKINVIDREGSSHELEAEEGLVLMEIIRDAGLPIEAACGGCAACATCHIYILDQKYEKILKNMEDDEKLMLDQTFHVQDNSRLACQIEYNEKLNGITVKLAPE